MIPCVSIELPSAGLKLPDPDLELPRPNMGLTRSDPGLKLADPHIDLNMVCITFLFKVRCRQGVLCVLHCVPSLFRGCVLYVSHCCCLSLVVLMSPFSESYYNSLACRPIVSRITIHWHVAL